MHHINVQPLDLLQESIFMMRCQFWQQRPICGGCRPARVSRISCSDAGSCLALYLSLRVLIELWWRSPATAMLPTSLTWRSPCQSLARQARTARYHSTQMHHWLLCNAHDQMAKVSYVPNLQQDLMRSSCQAAFALFGFTCLVEASQLVHCRCRG